MRQIRILFKKTGRAIYISHLDLMRTMTRLLRRAKLPVWYTEGFNPHLFLTFALPLSLGINGLYEPLDIKLTDDIMTYEEIYRQISKSVPEGIEIIEVFEPEMKHTEIAFAEFSIYTDDQRWEDFLKSDTIIISKKTKKGNTKEIDLKGSIKEFKIKDKKIDIILPAGCKENINPTLLVDAFSSNFKSDLSYTEIFRNCLYTSDMRIFR